MLDRLEKLFEKSEMDEAMGFLITDEANVTYLSGFHGEDALLIVSRKGNVLMTDGRYDEMARTACGDHFEVTKWFNPRRPDPATILHYVKKFGIKKLLFNDLALSYRHYDHLMKAIQDENLELTLHPMGNMVVELRAVKEAEEVELLRKACAISDEALLKTLPFIKAGVTELQIVATLEYHLKMCGADNISFDSIVLSGKKTSLPHGKPSDKVVEEGDFLQLDFGAEYRGYHADISRTFVIGEASEEQKKIYEMMLKATLESTAVLKDGIDASVPDAVVRSVIEDAYLTYYYPGLGHGVGLQVHESPSMSQTSKDKIKAGNVLTIEPGVYIPDWGGMRIEDTILVTTDGYEVLTKSPRHLQVL